MRNCLNARGPSNTTAFDRPAGRVLGMIPLDAPLYPILLRVHCSGEILKRFAKFEFEKLFAYIKLTLQMNFLLTFSYRTT